MTSRTRTSITVEIVSPGPSRATIEARPERAADRAPAHGRTSLPPRGPVGCCRRGTRRPRRLIGKCRAGAAAGNVSAEGEAIRSNDYRKDTTVKAPSTRPAAVLGLDVGMSCIVLSDTDRRSLPCNIGFGREKRGGQHAERKHLHRRVQARVRRLRHIDRQARSKSEAKRS